MESKTSKYSTTRCAILVLLLLLISFTGKLKAQERLVLNDNIYVLLKNASVLVLDNANSNALTVSGTGANIVSEAEDNRLKWNIADASGNYTIPFTNANGIKIPVSLNITNTGSADGYIRFSTLTDNDGVDSWNNEDYMPSGITNMNGIDGAGNNSSFVIDRFWVIDQESYTQNPSGTMSLAYDDAERTASGNSISSGTMLAQYWDEDNAAWAYNGSWGTLSTGTDNYPIHSVSAIETGSSFHKYWTLSQEDHPLPVDLIYFKAHQKNDKVLLDWSTATEINCDYFLIERSLDAKNWESLITREGAGDSNRSIAYQAVDLQPYSGVSYYRLKQYDFDGTFEYSQIEKVQFSSSEKLSQNNMILYPNPARTFIIVAPISIRQNLKYQILDISGKHIKAATVAPNGNKLKINVEELMEGAYYLRLQNDLEVFTLKFNKVL